MRFVDFIYHFPKGSIWQTRYVSLPFILIVTTFIISRNSIGFLESFGWFSFGIFLWTLLEYIFHRWLLHYDATSIVGKALMERLHIFHHKDTKDESQVCIPFVLQLPLWLGAWGIFLMFGGGFEASLFVTCGIALMMTLYDITHFSTHYMPATNRYLRYLKKSHMYHHFSNETKRFGVTTPFWDFIFRTY